MQIIIRMDDITPDMDWAKFERIRGILDKYNIKPLIGVVPDCRDELLHFNEPRDDFFEVIKGLMDNGWEVAQHGTYHVYETEDTGLLDINPFSEFAGLPYESQLEKIKTGQDILSGKGINTQIFMAPGHTYDENTLDALKALGFTALTDGLYDKPYIRNGIICVPCRLARIDRLTGIDTLCIHSNLMSDGEIDELETYIRSHTEDIISFSSLLAKNEVMDYSDKIKRAEKKVLEKRVSKGKIAESKRLAWYLSYTNHKNAKIKWLKRVAFLPLLLTNKYQGK